MIDCPNVEMRDRLPDLANDSLEPAVRELVLVHLTECTACTAEIEILRTARLILRQTTPKVNTASIALALPQYRAAPMSAAPVARRGWANSWRIAAAVTFLAAGIGSYRLLGDDSVARGPDSVAMRDTTVGLALIGTLADMSDAELNALVGEIESIEALPSTEIETVTSRISGPTILPDSVMQELEVR